ncbi:MAG: FtsL-like putative cell division protein [Bacteroidota bacterium]
MQIVSKQKVRSNSSNKEGANSKKGISAKKVDRYLRFLLFLTLIGMFYIWNTHYAVKQVRKMESLQHEVKDLKSKYLMREATLRAGTRLSEIKTAVDTLGLRPLSRPAYKLVPNSSSTPPHSPILAHE